MTVLTYTNTDGKSVELSSNSVYLLQKISGFENPKSTVYTTKSPNQDGETETGSTLDKKERTISGEIIADSIGQLNEYRRTLEVAFNTKTAGTLVYSDGTNTKKCDCKVEDLTIGTGENVLAQKFDVTLLCPKAFWQDTAESTDEIALWLSSFEFSEPDGFEIDAVEGMEFGERAPSLIVDVVNPGDVPCGMRIIFTALATLTNPSIFNVNTREQFKIMKTMSAGEVIEINTNFGSKRVTGIYNGDTLNYFNYAKIPGSTFMQLEPGSNPLRYDAEKGLDSLDVTIKFNPQYLGV